MSPQAEALLIGEIVPHLRVLIPHSVAQIGHEDHEELVQDSTVIALRMLNSAEQRGKQVSAGNTRHVENHCVGAVHFRPAPEGGGTCRRQR